MEKIMRKFLFLTLVLMLVGCTTTPLSVNESKPVPPDRVCEAYKKYSLPKEGQAHVIIVRDNGILGAAGSAALFLNGEILARIKAGESIKININAGDNILGIGPGTKMNWEKDNTELIEQTLNAEAEKTYYFRVTIDRTKGLVLQRTSQIK
jgi:hypothetical protein